MSTNDYINSLPTCPETGMKVQTYISSYHDNWEPELPEGWVVFDDRMSDEPKSDDLKWHEDIRVRRIGRETDVLLAAVANIPGVTFTPAEVN
jgi:hypothetical protein